MDPTIRTTRGESLRGDLLTSADIQPGDKIKTSAGDMEVVSVDRSPPGSYAARFAAYMTLQLSALLGSLGFTQRQNVPRDLWPHLEGMAASRAHHDLRFGGTSWHPPGGAYFASNAHKRAKLRARTGRR